MERLAARHGAELLRDYEGTSLDALRHMVGLGMGMSVFPNYYAQSEIRGDRTVTLKRLAGEPLARTIGLAMAHLIRAHERLQHGPHVGPPGADLP